MKSSIKKSTYQAIYRLLDMVSPIDYDCGKLCNSICCTYQGSESDMTEAEEMVIYLLPGEEKLFTMEEDWLNWTVENAEDYEFPDSWHGKIYSCKCKTPPFCNRKMRPLQCRFYPLAPHIDEDGTLRLILSATESMPYECPLIEKKMTLNESFVQATYTVWKRLITDPLIFDLVELDSDYRRESEEKITYVK